jgi:hypothetical protein
MRASRRLVGDETGAVIAIVAVTLVVLLGFLALGIDLGMLFVARTDAQRAADAAALAGASAFVDNQPATAVATARARAMEYARRNTFRNGPIDSSDVTITVIPDSSKVVVSVHRDSVRTWFGWLFGIRTVPVSADAAAVTSSAGAARCLRPFAVPDAWQDPTADVNNNHLWDPAEVWNLSDPGNFYNKYTGPGGRSNETGYGSSWRNPPSTPVVGDYGRQIQIMLSEPGNKSQLRPGTFFPWSLPASNNTCASGGGDPYRSNICSCNSSAISLNTDYQLLSGNRAGPTHQGVQELVNKDPNAYWDPGTNTVKGSTWGSNWMQSPRVTNIALFDPTQITASGKQTTIRFNNFAMMFIEAQNQSKDPLTGRFLYYVSGSGAPGTQNGSLVKGVHLVR